MAIMHPPRKIEGVLSPKRSGLVTKYVAIDGMDIFENSRKQGRDNQYDDYEIEALHLPVPLNSCCDNRTVNDTCDVGRNGFRFHT
jgi:hypothetical protein